LKRARSSPAVKLRRGQLRDLDALIAIENAVFTTDNLSRRSFRRLLRVQTATLLVAEERGRPSGYVLVFYRQHSKLARLYSIAVRLHSGGRGVGRLLLAAAEAAARRRRQRVMRLEVDQHNTRARALYEKSGYRLFGHRRNYYENGGDALRFEKSLGGEPRSRRVTR
jgi:ribosomal protein S18 acetylase RimI-like enzyme